MPIIMMALSIGGSEMSDSTVMIWRPRLAEEDLRGVGRRQRRAREVGDRQHGEQREVHQQVDDDHRDDAADHRSRQVAVGIAVFLREIQRALPSAVA